MLLRIAARLVLVYNMGTVVFLMKLYYDYKTVFDVRERRGDDIQAIQNVFKTSILVPEEDDMESHVLFIDNVFAPFFVNILA